MYFLLQQYSNKLVELLQKLKLLNETKPMNKIFLLAIYIDVNIGIKQ